VNGAETSASPGVQYVLVSSDGITREHCAGMADVLAGRPVTSATTFMAYSMSKTFTAAAALCLVAEDKLGLDDRVERWLEISPYGASATVRQLIAHTSGAPNPVPLRWVHPAERHAEFDEHAELAAILRRHPKPAFMPGTKFRYSNIGYWLLGRVIERASGEHFEACVRSRVLQPLGIAPSECAYTVQNAGDHAKGYLARWSLLNLVKRLVISDELIGRYEGRWLHINEHYVNGAAFGGLVGCARGFARFVHDQLAPRSAIFDATTRALFQEPQQTSSGAAIPMTLGWHIGAKSGRRFLYKEGGGGGFHCMMRVYPDAGRGSVIMTNATGVNVARMLDSLDR
jgi:CubicO group peptidase (beta-lactamase class C family)